MVVDKNLTRDATNSILPSVVASNLGKRKIADIFSPVNMIKRDVPLVRRRKLEPNRNKGANNAHIILNPI